MAIDLIIDVQLPGGDAAQKDVAALTAAVSKLATQRAALVKQLKELQKDEVGNAAAIKQVSAALAANERQMKTARTEQAQLQKELLATRGSLNAQRAELTRVTRAYDQMSVGVNATEEDMKSARAQIERMTDSIKEQEQATGRFQRNVGNYAGGIKEAFGQSGLGGALDAAKGGLMAVPQLAAAAFAFDAVRQGVQQIEELNKRIRETQTAVTQLTGAQGVELESQTAMVQALASTYDKDFKDVLVATNALSKQMGLSFEQAFAKIQQSFVNGADVSGELLDTVREFPSALSGAGISAQEFLDIYTQSVKSGVFSNKGIDQIKNASIRLKSDLTPAAEAALNAIGISGKELQDKIAKGELTVFQAIQQVSTQLSTLDPQTKRFGNVVSEVFGGAGEDAGLFVSQLGKVEVGFKDTSEQAKQMGLIFENNLKLEKLTQKLGDATQGIGKLVAEIKGFTLDAAANFVRGIEIVTGYGDAVAKVGTAAEGTKKSMFTLLKEQDAAEKLAKERERTELALLGLSKAQIEEIKKQKANTEELNAIAAKYGITVADVTALTKQDTKAREKNNEAIATGTTLLDELARAEYEAQQARMDQSVTPIGPRDFGTDLGGLAGDPTTPDIGSKRVEVAKSTEQQIQDAQNEIARQGMLERIEMEEQYAAAAGQIASNLSGLYSALEANQLKEAAGNEAAQLEIRKKFARRQAAIGVTTAVIDGIIGIQKTGANLGYPQAIPFQIAQGIATGINVAAIIANAAQFHTGGYTGDGGKYQPAGTVHKGEVVWSQEDVAAVGGAQAANSMRPTARGYADGGMVGAGTVSQARAISAYENTAAALRNMPPIYTRLTDIQRIAGRVSRQTDSAR
jgi:hypothetical protein